MTISHFSKRILVVGREVGPIVQLIKEKSPKVSVGAVDILGNEETRFNANWIFSIEKQSPDTSINRIKHRSTVDLLFELTLVMLEDIEFDLLIPLSPLQTEPEYILKLSREIEIYASSYRLLEQATSPYVFLTNISSNIPELISTSIFTSDLSSTQIEEFPIFFASSNGLSLIPSAKTIVSLDTSNLSGFILPISKIHCAFFLSCTHGLKILGLQTLSAPHEHIFFTDHLEKNAMTPFSKPEGITIERIISYLSHIITKLGVIGMGTIFFGFSKNCIFPVSCNFLIDENFAFWEKNSSRSLVPLLFSLESNSDPELNASINAFRFPIYSYRSIRVPSLPRDLCTQRNLPGVVSHPEYPLCAISARSSSFSSAQNLFQQKKKEILRILHT